MKRNNQNTVKRWGVVILLLLGVAQVAEVKERRKTRVSSTKQSELSEQIKGEWAEGKVVKVSDGDTVHVLQHEKTLLKIRLYGIDAPEKKQPYGQKCREELAQRVAGHSVKVWLREQDRYGRWIGKVTYSSKGEWKDVGLDLLQIGCAWHYKAFEKRQTVDDRKSYAQAESLGRSRQLGLWKERSQVAPWDFRKESRSAH